MIIEFTLNGEKYKKNADPGKRLVDFLREDMGLTGTKEGCGESECGACTVVLDGRAVHSCLVLAGQINFQCGYCTPGMLMSSAALLAENPSPTEDEVRTALAGNICRCGDYSAIIDAVLDAAERYKKDGGINV